MPNFKGGKKYKSAKHSESSAELHEVGDGQMIGRVIRVLGNRNMMLYCNDGKERMAHIRGGLRKKNACIELGDIVLFSLRGEGMRIAGESAGDTKDRGDILAKYDRDTYSQLKKSPGVNLKLFKSIETMDERQKANVGSEDDFGFTFEHQSDGEDEEDEGEGDKEEIARAREERKMNADKKRAMDRVKKQEGIPERDAGSGGGDGDDINIDDI